MDDSQGAEAPHSELRTPSHGNGKLAATITTETARDMAARSAEARKGKPWTYRERVRRLVRRGMTDDGTPIHEALANALVKKALAGDTKAQYLIAELVDEPRVTKREVSHGLSGDIMGRLAIAPDGDKRARIVDAPSLPPIAPESEPEQPIQPDSAP